MTDVAIVTKADREARECLCATLEISEPYRSEIIAGGNPIYELSPDSAIDAMLAFAHPLRVALEAVLGAVRDYLPPDGISAHDCLTRVIGAVDNPTINPIIGQSLPEDMS